MRAKNKEAVFPHSLMIYLLENYAAPSRGVLLNDFLSKSGIAKDDLVIAEKAKDLLSRLELRQLVFWHVSKINSKTQPLDEYKSELTTVITPFELYKVYAELTLDGIDYALKLVREKENFESTILTNTSVRLNVFVAILFSLIVIVTQIRTCAGEESRKDQEQHRLNQDSLKQLEQSKFDSTILNLLIRKNVGKDSLKTSKE